MKRVNNFLDYIASNPDAKIRYHASDMVLKKLDCIQDRMLKAAGVSEEEALTHFNLAPLSTRRGMALLGLIHRTTLGKGPHRFGELFRADSRSAGTQRRRFVQYDCDETDFM